MILQAVELIVEQLRAYISTQDQIEGGIDSGENAFVTLGNIALADSPDRAPQIQQRIVLSLVNVLEETTLKNKPNFERVNNRIQYRNAPVHLNLYLLFSANYDDYSNALIRLSQVVEFFQGKNRFSLDNSPIDLPDDELEALSEFRLSMDLYALSFEQINHLWGSLGGKQVPFVLYRMRIVEVQVDRPTAEGPPITEIHSNETIR